MEGSKLISIIIPSLHRPDLTYRCIRSLSLQTLDAAQYEIIVAENDADPTLTEDYPLPPNSRRLMLRANYGTTGAINRALAVNLSDYVLFLNNDIELQQNFVVSLLSALERDQRYGFASGKLLNSSDRTRLDGAGDALILGGGAYRLGHEDLDIGQFDRERPVLSGCGAATLFRRSVLEEIDGLDEDFFAYLDDVDLALRAQLLGYGGVYVPSAVAYHSGSATLGDTLHPRIVELTTRNQLFLVVKNYPSGLLARLLPRIAVFQLLWFGFAASKRRLIPYLRGMGGAIRSLPRMVQKRKRLMGSRRTSDAEFLELLRFSESQVYLWHHTRASGRSSTLLKIYFALFGGSQGDHAQLRQS